MDCKGRSIIWLCLQIGRADAWTSVWCAIHQGHSHLLSTRTHFTSSLPSPPSLPLISFHIITDNHAFMLSAAFLRNYKKSMSSADRDDHFYSSSHREWQTHVHQLRRGESLTHLCLLTTDLGLNKQFDIGRLEFTTDNKNMGWDWGK